MCKQDSRLFALAVVDFNHMFLLFLLFTFSLSLLKLWKLFQKLLLLPTQLVLDHLTIKLTVLRVIAVSLGIGNQIFNEFVFWLTRICKHFLLLNKLYSGVLFVFWNFGFVLALDSLSLIWLFQKLLHFICKIVFLGTYKNLAGSIFTPL